MTEVQTAKMLEALNCFAKGIALLADAGGADILQQLPAAPASAPDDSNGGWMTTAEAAEYMKMSTRSVLIWAKKGWLKGRQAGRHWKFKRSACDRAMRERGK